MITNFVMISVNFVSHEYISNGVYIRFIIIGFGDIMTYIPIYMHV